jgi:hypothetical protein
MSQSLSITIELLRDIYARQQAAAACGVARAIAGPVAREEFLRQVRETRPPSRETAISKKPTIENL